MPQDSHHRDFIDQVAARFNKAIPFNHELGLQVLAVGDGRVTTGLDYRPEFLGDPTAGLWHTAIATTMADSSCGLAIHLALQIVETIATLDLRMDYLRPAVAHQPLRAEAECHHITQCIAFVRARLHQGDETRPTAQCHATFMRVGQSA